MRQQILEAIIIVLLISSIVGCVKNTPPETSQKQSSIEAVDTMSAEMTSIDTMQQDLQFPELEALDQQLSDINW